MADPHQLPFDLPIVERRGADDWIVAASNRAATDLVARFPEWPSDVVVLVGPPGSGKSHLAQMFAERAGARVVAAADLSRLDPVALADEGPVVLEDAGPRTDERALFHLLNALRERGRALLVTAVAAPAGWGTGLADLASRLRAATPVDLREPDDALLAALLAKLFADRQIAVDPAVVDYVVRRMERSFVGARALVGALDRAALAAKSPITRAVAARVLLGDDVEPQLPGLDEFSPEEDSSS